MRDDRSPLTPKPHASSAFADALFRNVTRLAALIVFSLLAETLRLSAPQIYMMMLGLLLILSVLYLPGGLASMRWETFRVWWSDTRSWWRLHRIQWSGEEERAKRRRKERRLV